MIISGYITWDPDPTIFSLAGLQLRWYGVLFASSFFFGYVLLEKMFRKDGAPKNLPDKLVIYMGLGTLLGARIGHCLLYQPEYYLSHPVEILYVWNGGLASHGAAIGILLALLIFSLREKINYFWILDRIVVVVALSGFLIRMGNLFNSEIPGKVTDVSWAFIFPAIDNLPRHPAQLYEAISYLVIFLLLGILFFSTDLKLRKGLLFSCFLILVFGMRFIIEFYKENQVDNEGSLLLNFGQLYSIPLVFAGIALLIFISLRREQSG